MSKYHSEVAPTMGMLLISANNLDPWHELRSIKMWDNGMDINLEEETSYTT